MRGRLEKVFHRSGKVLRWGVKIERVNETDIFSVSPADGSYKVNFGEEGYELFKNSCVRNWWKCCLIPHRIEVNTITW